MRENEHKPRLLDEKAIEHERSWMLGWSAVHGPIFRRDGAGYFAGSNGYSAMRGDTYRPNESRRPQERTPRQKRKQKEK
jgi:hypothetical protein